MRSLSIVAAVLLVISLGGSEANAQQKKGGAPPPAAETVKYFWLNDDFLGELPVDGTIKEVRQGGKITSASLDLCHSITVNTPRKDRFVIPLKVEGTKFTGAGQTQETKQHIAVELMRKQTGKTVTFEGSITFGDDKWDMSSTENEEMNEKDYLESQAPGYSIISDPQDFTQVSPGTIAVQVKRESFLGLVKEVKGQNVQVMLDSIPVDCTGLRTGQQVLQFVVDPARAPAIVKKLKTLPGVTEAGWTSGNYSIDRSVRIALADWSGGGGGFDKDRLATAIAGALAKNFGGATQGTSWNAATGELKVSLKRPSQSVPGLGLSDHIDVVMVVSPEKLQSNTGLVVWLRDTAIEIVDEGPEPRLKFASAASDESGLIDEITLLDILAEDLKGKPWDSDQAAWRK
jgi:hypothetical protein